MNPQTGLVVNVTDIDAVVRAHAVPIFAERIRREFRAGRGIDFAMLGELLDQVRQSLADKFGPANLDRLTLRLNPFRELTMNCRDTRLLCFTEKFEFAATHKLWNDGFSEQRNFEVFGKCANPAGHGHNYIVEVTLKIPAGHALAICDFEKVVDEELICLLDHKNINIEVPYFARAIPTVENIAVFAWDRLTGRFSNGRLARVTVWETDKTYCSYSG